MRTPRVFEPHLIQVGQKFHVSSSNAHYIRTVLRLSTGDVVSVFNGLGGEYFCEAIEIKKNLVLVEVKHFDPIERESSLSIHLGIGISRGERMDFVIQKTTELGVDIITPLFTRRSEVKLPAARLKKKLSHWQQIAITACRQSMRNRIPKLANPKTVSDWVISVNEHVRFVLDPRCQKTVTTFIKAANSVSLLVGPEGGLDEEEIKITESANFHKLSLGPRILRTETAPIAAISILQSVWGDMK